MIHAERIERAARRLREMEASGVRAHEILGGEAGAAFVRDYCGGNPEVAAAAFAQVHAPSASPSRRVHATWGRRAHLRGL